MRLAGAIRSATVLVRLPPVDRLMTASVPAFTKWC